MKTQREIEELARDSQRRGLQRDAAKLREVLGMALSENPLSPAGFERVCDDVARAVEIVDRLEARGAGRLAGSKRTEEQRMGTSQTTIRMAERMQHILAKEAARAEIEAALAEIPDQPAGLDATAVERIELSLSRAVEILSR